MYSDHSHLSSFSGEMLVLSMDDAFRESDVDSDDADLQQWITNSLDAKFHKEIPLTCAFLKLNLSDFASYAIYPETRKMNSFEAVADSFNRGGLNACIESNVVLMFNSGKSDIPLHNVLPNVLQLMLPYLSARDLSLVMQCCTATTPNAYSVFRPTTYLTSENFREAVCVLYGDMHLMNPTGARHRTTLLKVKSTALPGLPTHDYASIRSCCRSDHANLDCLDQDDGDGIDDRFADDRNELKRVTLSLAIRDDVVIVRLFVCIVPKAYSANVDKIVDAAFMTFHDTRCQLMIMFDVKRLQDYSKKTQARADPDELLCTWGVDALRARFGIMCIDPMLAHDIIAKTNSGPSAMLDLAYVMWYLAKVPSSKLSEAMRFLLRRASSPGPGPTHPSQSPGDPGEELFATAFLRSSAAILLCFMDYSRVEVCVRRSFTWTHNGRPWYAELLHIMSLPHRAQLLDMILRRVRDDPQSGGAVMTEEYC